jgi:hypothetical protein
MAALVAVVTLNFTILLFLEVGTEGLILVGFLFVF